MSNSYPFDQQLIDQVIHIAEGAAQKIMKVYQDMRQVEVTNKEDDSPLTKADLAAHHHICDKLKEISEFPILSEESKGISAEERLSWESYWLVDPLDGTKEFIAKNDEFTVNIALIHKQQVIMGVVYVPVTQVCYSAGKGLGASKTEKGSSIKIQTRSLSKSIEKGEIVLVGSRRHGSDALEALVNDLKKELCDKVNLISQGSSLKFCALAEGRADLYPRLALTCEWDTAAAQIVLEEAGGAVLNPDLSQMKYNTKEELLNPFFWAISDNCEQWQAILKGRIS
jgi:3'(2'), 5'-bisphosphate nucleotidase